MKSAYSVSDVESFVARMWAGATFITPYAYSYQFTGLAGQAGTTTGTINIAANADFLLLALALRPSIGAVQTNATQPVPFIRAQLTDTGSGENFFAQAIDVGSVSTNNERTKALPYPRILQGKTAVSVTLTGWAPAAETYAGELVLEGVQVRAYTPSGR